MEQFRQFRPSKPSTIGTGDYLICKEGKINGPYPKEGIMAMIQDGSLTIFDYVAVWGSSSWVMIKKIPYFERNIPIPPDFYSESSEETSNTIILEKRHGGLELTPEIIRKYPRAPYSANSTVEIGNKSFAGVCTTLATGGCFIEIRTDPFKIGDKLFIHINSDMIRIDIKVHGKITSINEDNVRGIGIQFLELDKKIEFEINNFVNKYIAMIKSRNSKKQ
ncbi:MAG: PilZ domain-containing protein [Bacteriovoracaceae bacterium]|nr:PilZ domain-containing protein [Bacteriovoracaceae bacterium]